MRLGQLRRLIVDKAKLVGTQPAQLVIGFSLGSCVCVRVSARAIAAPSF